MPTIKSASRLKRPKALSNKKGSIDGGKAARSPQAVGLHQTQKYKVNKRRTDYSYEPKVNEFTEEMLHMSGGNKYHEGTNLLVNQLINGLQGTIFSTNKAKADLRDHSQKIFDLMKKERRQYIKTLVKGEAEGHCKGIAKRLD